VEVEPVTPFTEAQVTKLRAAAPGWFGVAFTLGLGAGLRQSEATGLTLDRIDFLRRTLTVDRQLVSPTVDGVRFGPPKTKRSYRSVPLADAVVAELARHIEVHGVGDHDLVLHTPKGRPVTRQHFGDTWRSLRDRAERPKARFHDTRHTFASTLLAGGVSVPAVAEYLGHTPTELLRTYAHLMPGDHDRARSAVQSAFDGAASCVTPVSSVVVNDAD
jgi:integrase